MFTFPWDGLWGWFYYKANFNMCISFRKVGKSRDACKDKTEMIFLIFFMVSFWYQIGIKKIIKIPNEYWIQASKGIYFKAKKRSDHAKGQLISKCLFGVIVWTKIEQKYCKDFCFLGASWKPKKVPGSPQDATKNFRAEILAIFTVLFWSKLWHQKDISKLTDLSALNYHKKSRVISKNVQKKQCYF